MLRILLIRHGETILLGRTLYGRMPGVRLSPKGYEQAKALGSFLKPRYQISEIVSSPMERTQETARFLADDFNLPLLTDPNFNEIDFGGWMGKDFAELANLDAWKLYNRRRSVTRPPGGESLAEVQNRASAGLQIIAERLAPAADATVALVTHGDVIRALLMLLLGMPGDFIHRIEVGPGSVSEVLLFSGFEPRVISINREF